MRKNNHPLVNRFFSQYVRRPLGVREQMRGIYAVTFRPSHKSESFLDKLFLPLGVATMIVQTSHPSPSDKAERPREQVVLSGIRARRDGNEIVYGGPGKGLFDYDLGLRPFVKASGKIIDPERNPGLLRLSLDMDAIRRRAVDRNWELPVIPDMPELFLAFDMEKPMPDCEDTPVLRQRIAEHMARDVTEIDAMDDTDRWMLLRTEWPDLFTIYTDPVTQREYRMISRGFCSAIQQADKLYEYFGSLLGLDVWNVARKLCDLEIENPARQVLDAFGYKAGEESEMTRLEEDCERDPELSGHLVERMRQAIGPQSQLYSDDDMCEALCTPDVELTTTNGKTPLEVYGQTRTLAAMRKELDPAVSECCTDADLLAAAENPREPLRASGACRIQLLYANTEVPPENRYQFSAEELSHESTRIDLWTAPRWFAAKEKKSDAVVAAGT